MKNKIALISILTFVTTLCFAQAPERIQTAQSANLKAPSEKAMEFYNNGFDDFENKDYTAAIRNYKSAIAIDSDYVDAYNNLGLTFYEEEQLDSASFFLQKSLQKYPTGITALQNLALVEEKKINLSKALEYYQRIAKLDPANPEGFYNAGRILATMGKLDDALVQAQHAETLYAKSNSRYVSDCHYLLLVIHTNMNNKPIAKKYLALCKKENVEVPSDIENALQ